MFLGEMRTSILRCFDLQVEGNFCLWTPERFDNYGKNKYIGKQVNTSCRKIANVMLSLSTKFYRGANTTVQGFLMGVRVLETYDENVDVKSFWSKFFAIKLGTTTTNLTEKL